MSSPDKSPERCTIETAEKTKKLKANDLKKLENNLFRLVTIKQEPLLIDARR